MTDKANKMCGSGTSKQIGYRVEARDTHFSQVKPVTLNDGLLGPEWREVDFAEEMNPAGIPTDYYYWGSISAHRLLTYEGAVALAWTIIAQNPYRSIECRLRRYKLETHYTLEKIGVVDQPAITKALFHRDIPIVSEAGQVAVPTPVARLEQAAPSEIEPQATDNLRSDEGRKDGL